MSTQTIYALSSGALPSGVAIIRLSGPAAIDVGKTLSGAPSLSRRASLCCLRDADGALLDEALVLAFSAPNSFTGENVVEFHCHGGRATVSAILNTLSQQPGLRAAEPGEFSRRAFLNNRMDLTALEGLSDLIAAQTEEQRRQALDHAGGALRSLYEDWRTKLIQSRALVEAELDFSDEEDVPGSVSEQVWLTVSRLADNLDRHLTSGKSGEIVREGYRVALVGAPNVGKSSLLNALAKRDVAIVTDQAGTTRDVLEVSLDINGYLVVLSDTAGLRETVDVVEKEGIRRATVTMKNADLILHLSDSAFFGDLGVDGEIVRVSTKADLSRNYRSDGSISISSETGLGVSDLLKFIGVRLADHRYDIEEPGFSRVRHREILSGCLSHLQASLGENLPLELRSEELRLAGDKLGRLTGQIDTEHLLDVIFSEFCIGK